MHNSFVVQIWQALGNLIGYLLGHLFTYLVVVLVKEIVEVAIPGVLHDELVLLFVLEDLKKFYDVGVFGMLQDLHLGPLL